MARAKKKKRAVPKKTVKTTKAAKTSKAGLDRKLIENFISLQRVLTNLSIKFDNLANQISKLLGLFEISAKSLAKRDFEFGSSKDIREVGSKIDNLFEQNKVIARGLTMMHERLSGQIPPRPQRPAQAVQTPASQIPPQQAPPRQPPRQVQRPAQPQRAQTPAQKPEGVSMEGYEKSISSQPTQQTEFKKLKKSEK